MGFLWPAALAALVLVPLLAAAYMWVLRRRRRFVVRFSSLTLVRAALPRHSLLRRHLPFALLLLALTSLGVALARPTATVSVPSGRTTIILALDVSRSMLADDIPPSRIVAAQEAALSFVRNQQPTAQIGIVAFAGFAEMVQAPTSDKQALETAIRTLTTGRGTAIGSGILRSLDALAGLEAGASANMDLEAPAAPPVLPGAFAPDVIVLLTDGVRTTGPMPLEAAQRAVERGIRVYTIGFGTAAGGSLPNSPPLAGPNNSQPQFGQGGGRFRRGIDEATLQQVADLTGGEYYAAESAGELEQVFRELPSYLTTREERTELSAAFTALGALLATAAVALSLRWNPLG